MIEPDRMPRLVFKPGHRRDRNPVMLVVVGHEREHAVAVNDLGLQHGRVPIDHRLELLGGEHGVREFRGYDAPGSVSVLG